MKMYFYIVLSMIPEEKVARFLSVNSAWLVNVLQDTFKGPLQSCNAKSSL